MTTNNTDTTPIQIFDTTLRDGEQSPGAAMTHEEKLQIAELLDEMGVDIIEAGFPISSQGDFQRGAGDQQDRQARLGLRPLPRRLQGYRPRRRSPEGRTSSPHSHVYFHQPRAYEAQAEHGRKCGAGSDRRVASPAPATSPPKWNGRRKTPPARCRISCANASMWRSHAGATVINVPDTVGYSTPQEFFDIITMLRERVPNADKVIFSTHVHNDLGLAVANSLAGVLAGARQVECTINGIGERAGNAALEEIVMALKVRKDIMPFTTNINTTLLNRASKLVSNVTGFPVQYNKAIVGKNAFSHEVRHPSGRHAEECRDLRDHAARGCGGECHLADAGQAVGPPCLPRQAGKHGLCAGRRGLRGRLPALQGPGRQEKACLRRGYRRPGG